MKFVALLSGGKDSCFNIVHCQRLGHQLVAAASLRPEEGIGSSFSFITMDPSIWTSTLDELDSYLYQTVGQDAIQFVADALAVPLYRRTIRGTAVELSNEYGDRSSAFEEVSGDETEDMLTLLQDVKVKISTISIKRSIYFTEFIPWHRRSISRRNSVNVSESTSRACVSLQGYKESQLLIITLQSCRRLGLTALCYLWQRDQKELLDEMIEAGVEAVLIKVAGIGLKPQHLGHSLAQMRPILHSMVR